MHLPLFIWWFIVIFCVKLLHADNPTSIVPPMSGPDPGYIIAESTSGLGNRLRVLAAYMYLGEVKYGGAHLVFIWDKNEPCPGHFLSIFEPLPNVIFATNSSRYVLDKGAKVVHENSYAVFTWIMLQNGIPKNRFGYPTWTEIEYRMFSRYVPVREVMLKVNDYVRLHNICNCSAMHIRSTDLDMVMGERKRTHLPSYYHFVESRPPEEPVFLLTDSPETQQHFLTKYGRNKILVYHDIDPVSKQKPLVIKSDNYATSGNLTADHRYTTLEHTLIDVLIAAHAKHFKASVFSSLSDLVKMFDLIGKRDRSWCAGYL